MFTLLNDLNECICNDEKYKAYIEAKKQLEKEDINQLLKKYQNISHDYFKLKQYEKYTDISSSKKEYIEIKKQISNKQIIQEYYTKYYELNGLLEEVTKIIFSGISDELLLDRYLL